MVHLDEATMDFPRNIHGKIETEDFYIPCKCGGDITHYGQNVLTAFVPSAIKGRNILKKLETDGIDYFDVLPGDGELTFRFKAKDMDKVAGYMGAKTLGSNIRPFSNKNLPKSSYRIPEEDMKSYKEIIKRVSGDNILEIHRITDSFIQENLKNANADIKKKCMARQHKEYIHSQGLWNVYIKYLQTNLH